MTHEKPHLHIFEVKSESFDHSCIDDEYDNDIDVGHVSSRFCNCEMEQE